MSRARQPKALLHPEAEHFIYLQKALGAISIESYNLKNLPPQGDMSDKDYMLMLMRLREEADKPTGEPGSALHAINP